MHAVDGEAGRVAYHEPLVDHLYELHGARALDLLDAPVPLTSPVDLVDEDTALHSDAQTRARTLSHQPCHAHVSDIQNTNHKY